MHTFQTQNYFAQETAKALKVRCFKSVRNCSFVIFLNLSFVFQIQNYSAQETLKVLEVSFF